MCGENLGGRLAWFYCAGSSPRVRGKLDPAAIDYALSRLIPACAGKTRRPRRRQAPPTAHPRVCGENFRWVGGPLTCGGSSPRVRGKHPKNGGKQNDPQAHPRVCGENTGGLVAPRFAAGSSPRVRGKHPARLLASLGGRLIPACAGKTNKGKAPELQRRAHPRVCGENEGFTGEVVGVSGSSPRVRGKH